MIVLTSEEWIFAMSNKGILQRDTRFLQRVTSATSNKRISQRVMSDSLERATSATINERISQWGTSEFLQQGISSNEQGANFTTRNEWFYKK